MEKGKTDVKFLPAYRKILRIEEATFEHQVYRCFKADTKPLRAMRCQMLSRIRCMRVRLILMWLEAVDPTLARTQ